LTRRRCSRCSASRRTSEAEEHSPGTYGWNGGLGTSWFNDPAADQAIED
jgi:hypothetical protein